MKKDKHKKMNIGVPDIREFTIKADGKLQKGSYAVLPSGCRREFLEEDVKNGAEIYKEMLEAINSEKNDSRISFIEAKSKEDGIRGMLYLSIIHNFMDGDLSYDEPDFEEDLEFDPDIYFEDEEDSYVERYGQIPLINMSEGRNFILSNSDDVEGNIFGMQFMAAQKPSHPWWENCINEPVCIICDVLGGFMESGVLDKVERDVVKLFSGNRRVYVILLDHVPMDLTIQKALVEFTANLYRVEKDEEKRLDYYELLMKETADIYGFKFNPLLNLRTITKKLVSIDMNSSAGEFLKVFRYLDHIGTPKVLKASDFGKLGLEFKVVKEDGQQDISQTIYGMEGVKEQITAFLRLLEYQKLLHTKGIKCADIHSVLLFIGPPGTAKTTWAKHVADECKKKGLVSGGRFISLSGAQLKGQYLGQTAHRVHEIFIENDIIFIDEAYSLTDGGGECDLYAREALAQLAVELEEHANDKIVIFAGYGGRKLSPKDNKMFQFLQENPGISSRIGYTVYFDSYDADDMVNIVHCLAESDSLIVSHKFDDRIRAYFEKRVSAHDFGNGREARVLLDHCKTQLASRVIVKENPSEKELKNVLLWDLEGAIKELETGNMERSGRVFRKPGLV